MTNTENFDPEHTEPLLIVISGPSGVGKDSVINSMKERPLPFHFVVTATTRPKRNGEQHGVDYIFVTHEEFARMMQQNELLEFAYVYNDYKGIPRNQVSEALDSGKDVVMRLDVQGAATIRKLYPEAVLVFLTTSTEDELVKRLEKRKSESAEQRSMRIAMARQELRRINEFDYVVVNRDNQLEETVDTILAIITAEHHRVDPRVITL